MSASPWPITPAPAWSPEISSWPPSSTPTARRSGIQAISRWYPRAAGWRPVASTVTQLYHVAPIPGQWELVLDWSNPVVGDELADPFTGAVAFNQVSVSSNLPDSTSASVPALTSTAFDVHVKNTGVAPEGFFVDPRLDNQTETVDLPNQNPAVTATSLHDPAPGRFFVPLLPGPHAHDRAPGQRFQRRWEHAGYVRHGVPPR